MRTPIRGSALPTPLRLRPLVVAGTLAAVLALAACNQREETKSTAPQDDAAIAEAGVKVDAAKTAPERDTEQARQAVDEAARAAAEVVADSAITAQVKARLAADFDLRTLDVSVETQAGRVSLRGTAPDAAARDRAAQLAAAVKGVAVVDNHLGTSR